MFLLAVDRDLRGVPVQHDSLQRVDGFHLRHKLPFDPCQASDALGFENAIFTGKLHDIDLPLEQRRADGINNFDLSLFKNLRIREKVTAQFRLENFNALNHVQFAGPNVNPVNAAFGSITAEKGHGQRQITLGFKLLF